MLPTRICPWGLAALALAELGMLLASLVGVRSLTISLAVLGLATAALGVWMTREERDTTDRVWLTIGSGFSAMVLILALFVPGVLNSFWTIDFPIPERDPQKMVLVPRERPLDKGRAVTEKDWADAEKEGILQDDVFVRIESVKTGQVPGRGNTPYLLIHFRVVQVWMERHNVYKGFDHSTHRLGLTDEVGQSYAFLEQRRRRRVPGPLVFEPVPAKGEVVLVPHITLDHLLVFELPTSGFEVLNFEVPASAWGRQGTCRFRIRGTGRHQNVPTPPPAVDPKLEMARLIAHYKKLVTGPGQPPDRSLGRAIFAKSCQECHTFYGIGGKIGPNLSESKKRADLDFVLTSIIDPSAVIEKEFQPSIVFTTAGQLITGIVKGQDARSVMLQTSNKLMVLLRTDIEELRPSKTSIMPVDLLKGFDNHEVRSLVAYVCHSSQAPLLANAENVNAFFYNGQDFKSWRVIRGAWKLERGEILAPGPEAGMAGYLVSDTLLSGDFHFTVHVQPGRTGTATVCLIGDNGALGPRVRLAAAQPVVLFPASEKGSRAAGTQDLAPDTWNKIEVIVTGKHLEVKVNGHAEVSADDESLPRRCLVALEGPAMADQDVKFRHLDVRLLSVSK